MISQRLKSRWKKWITQRGSLLQEFEPHPLGASVATGVDSRTHPDNLFLVRDFCVLSIPSLFHGLDLLKPVPKTHALVN